MKTVPGLLAVVGLVPTTSAKPGQRNDVSELLYRVLESSEMHPVKSMKTFSVLGRGVTCPWITPTPILLDIDLAAAPFSPLSITHYIWEQSQGGMKETSAGVNPSCMSAQQHSFS